MLDMTIQSNQMVLSNHSLSLWKIISKKELMEIIEKLKKPGKELTTLSLSSSYSSCILVR